MAYIRGEIITKTINMGFHGWKQAVKDGEGGYEEFFEILLKSFCVKVSCIIKIESRCFF